MTSVPSDSLPPHAYLQQLLRAYRFRDRYAALIRSRSSVPDLSFNDLEDFLWASFQNVWHVKDWLYNDPSVDRAVAKAAVSDAERSRPLLIVADMANGTKHYLLKNERVGAHDAAIQIVDNPDGSFSCHHELRLQDGSCLRAIDALDYALTTWNGIFRTHGLVSVGDRDQAI